MLGPVASLLLLAGLAQAAAPLDPAQAIALAEKAPNQKPKIDCAMTVASTERTSKGIYLHSTDDYRRADDLTVLVAHPLAKQLSKQLGAPIETALNGKHIVVRGIITSVPIVNTFAGRPRSFNRTQHEILVQTPQQVLSLG